MYNTDTTGPYKPPADLGLDREKRTLLPGGARLVALLLLCAAGSGWLTSVAVLSWAFFPFVAKREPTLLEMLSLDWSIPFIAGLALAAMISQRLVRWRYLIIGAAIAGGGGAALATYAIWDKSVWIGHLAVGVGALASGLVVLAPIALVMVAKKRRGLLLALSILASKAGYEAGKAVLPLVTGAANSENAIETFWSGLVWCGVGSVLLLTAALLWRRSWKFEAESDLNAGDGNMTAGSVFVAVAVLAFFGYLGFFESIGIVWEVMVPPIPGAAGGEYSLYLLLKEAGWLLNFPLVIMLGLLADRGWRLAMVAPFFAVHCAAAVALKWVDTPVLAFVLGPALIELENGLVLLVVMLAVFDAFDARRVVPVAAVVVAICEITSIISILVMDVDWFREIQWALVPVFMSVAFVGAVFAFKLRSPQTLEG